MAMRLLQQQTRGSPSIGRSQAGTRFRIQFVERIGNFPRRARCVELRCNAPYLTRLISTYSRRRKVVSLGSCCVFSSVHVAAKATLTREMERLKMQLVTATVPRSGEKARILTTLTLRWSTSAHSVQWHLREAQAYRESIIQLLPSRWIPMNQL